MQAISGRIVPVAVAPRTKLKASIMAVMAQQKMQSAIRSPANPAAGNSPAEDISPRCSTLAIMPPGDTLSQEESIPEQGVQ